MPVFTWEGRTRQGTVKKGVIEAANEAGTGSGAAGPVDIAIVE